MAASEYSVHESEFNEFAAAFQLEPQQPIQSTDFPQHVDLAKPQEARNYNLSKVQYFNLPHEDQVGWAKTVNALNNLLSTLKQSQSFSTVDALQKTIQSYNPKYTNVKLVNLETAVSQAPFSEWFFTQTLPNMITFALRIEVLFPLGLPCLVPGGDVQAITLSAEQVACLISNLFLCTYVAHNTRVSSRANFYERAGYRYPVIDCYKLYTEPARQCVQKIKCFLNYLNRVTAREGHLLQGGITFERKIFKDIDPEAWKAPVGENSCATTVNRIIEKCHGCIQVDFADRVFGGLILVKPAAQEEVMLCHRPELLAGRLFTALLQDGEALHIVGCEMYNKIKGYSWNFAWDGDYFDGTSRDEFGRIRSNVCAIDALHLKSMEEGFGKSAVDRDLIKACVGFMPVTVQNNYFNAVATGFWGCGIFNGDKEMKALTQLLACILTGRTMVFCSFGDKDFADRLDHVCQLMHKKGVNAADLYRRLETAKPCNSIFEQILEDLS